MSQNTTDNMNNNLLNQYTESKRIIRQAMDEYQLVLFVGAGASIASGMPSWSEAIQIIANSVFFFRKTLASFPQR